ncbi:hypothetical protein [Desulfobulbus elongatus]|uniref:hypothetical protein n=1 Tax=Desulfobulbus elongatus TaxID=53332 RepID=UPI000481108D|nr:hypothetical protein [Desulfobulbus elongatus]
MDANSVEIDEGTASTHHIMSLNEGGDIIVDSESIRYRLVSAKGQDIIPWTVLPAGNAVKLSGAVNTIGEHGPVRFLTFEVTHNGGDTITKELKIRIVDLKGI